MPEMTMGMAVMERSNLVIIHRAVALSMRPTMRMNRVSTRPIMRPTTSMEISEPMPRGMLAQPLSRAE